MRITMEADYALRICAMLAQAKQPIGAPQLAATLGIPPRFASKILRKLLLAKHLRSARGVNGGFSLNKEASCLTLRQIIEALDGPVAIRHCLMADNVCSFQSDKAKCRFHAVFGELNNIITGRLDMLTLADMVDAEIPVSALKQRLYKF